MPEDPKTDDTQDVIEATAEDVEISDPDTPDEPPSSGKRGRGPIIALAVVVLVVAAAVAVVVLKPDLVQLALGTPEPVVSAEQLAALEAANKKTASELASLRTRVIALAGRVETLGAPEDQSPRIAALEKKLEELAAAGGTPSPAAAGSDAEARAKIAALTERLAALEAARAAPPETGATADQQKIAEERIKALQDALAARDQQMTAMRAENERLVHSVGGLAERLAKLEQKGAASGGVASETAALVLAAGQLRQALARPGPFAEELASLSALAGDDAVVTQTIATLEPSAAKGLTTRRMLANRFDAMARTVVQAAIASENPGWVDKALARLAGVVTVRPTGDNVEGDSPAAVLARGEARLRVGDLAGAVKQLETLTGAPAKAASAWLADARARLDADRAAAALNRHVIGRMAGTAPQTVEPATK